MQRFLFSIFASVALFLASCAPQPEIYVAPDGSDDATGSVTNPLASVAEAIRRVVPGQSIVLREGVYKPQMADTMGSFMENLYSCVYVLDKDGTPDAPFTIRGMEGEKAVIDLSDVRSSNSRIIGFCLKGAHWRLANFEIVGIQVAIPHHTQSECIGIYGASYCVVERVNMHDGMGIGIYAKRGHNNLVINCDAYNNYDDFSKGGKGGNTDGFGFHFNSPDDTCNVMKGCRAWCNSDDGFDLINCYAPVSIDSCWAFWNGFDKDMNRRADGTGFKAGGYGLRRLAPFEVPRHSVSNSIAWANRNRGFYANHHLGGINWVQNAAYDNPTNFSMVNQKSWADNEDVPGYGHSILRNIAYVSKQADIVMVDTERSFLSANRFGSDALLSDSSFVSLDGRELLSPRQKDGSLPRIDFLKLR